MNLRELIQNIRRSVFVKLVFIYALTALLTIFLIAGMARHFTHVHDQVWSNRSGTRLEYGNLLTDSIGNPPDFKKADDIVNRTGMRIRIEGKNISYANPSYVTSIASVEQDAKRCIWKPETKIMSYNGRIYILIVRNEISYLYSYENDNFFDERPEWWPILVSLMLIALLLNYFAARWLFHPIYWLSEGMKKVQKGELTTEIKSRENDELGDLTKSFNHMTKEVSVMLQLKEQLLLDVSHELRSPLTRMKVALELEEETMGDEIKKNVRDLEVMISELLESARLDTSQGKLHKVSTPVLPLLERVVSKFHNEAPGVKIIPSVSTHISVPMDEARVETVLRNLLENALKYSKHQREAVEIAVLNENANEVWIQVRDFGNGIPDDEQKHVFEPFYRVDKSRVRETGGYGLGLALCKKIMNAHQGSIEVTSSNAQGTVFTLKFKINS